LSLKIGINATANAPLESAKNRKSGILKAAKYASLPKSVKFSELINEVLSRPRNVDTSAKLANKNAAELTDSLLLGLLKIFAITAHKYRLRLAELKVL
jgi:hypothetical protein